MMRVLFAVSSLSAGGAERVIAELANAFVAAGDEVGVLTLSHPGSAHYALDPRVTRIALDVIWNSINPWESVRSNLRRSHMIRRAVKGFRPDCVVSFIEQTNVRVLAALLGTGIPVIVSERTDPRRHAVGRAWALARRLFYPTARRLVVQTPAVADWAKEVVGAHKVRVIPNFVRDLPAAPDSATRRADEILAAGRLGPEKGFDVLLRAFAQSGLAAQGLRLVILGEGSERPALADLAQDLGVAASVEMPGVVPDPERWMARCAFYVLPSRYEGFPNALLEAMAMGCAVIAADCDSGPRELVRHGENGLLVPVADVAALTQAMRDLASDPALRARLGHAAQAVRARYDKATIVAEWRNVIEEVVGG
jgi:glycosyltransferase involved in cell wall biosynthesis